MTDGKETKQGFLTEKKQDPSHCRFAFTVEKHAHVFQMLFIAIQLLQSTNSKKYNRHPRLQNEM